MSEPREFRLSNRDDMALFLAILVKIGGICPKCGYGTRNTSKRWARCKNPECGDRVERQSLKPVDVAPPGPSPVEGAGEEPQG